MEIISQAALKTKQNKKNLYLNQKEQSLASIAPTF